MTFEQWSPFPIIIFFSCCSDNIVVVGCIFTKTKTNIKKWRCAIHTSTGVTGSGGSVDLFSFFSVLAKEPLAQYTAFFHLQLWADVSCHFLFPCIFILYFSQGYTALEGLRWSVSVLGPVILWTEVLLASQGIRHWAGPGSTFTWPFYCLPGGCEDFKNQLRIWNWSVWSIY